MKALRIQDDGYAGFYRPEDVILEPSLSVEQKYETLKHWQLLLARRARVAPVSERETYETLTIELAAAIECVDNAPSSANIKP
jgi:hypothetical protein